ncbi:MAG: sigma-70 family RNA polymerase sigma factor [Colwellia sp.]|nr:sigma-70 family RNA polymerase sigma factor [Colwellia sp.]
MNKTSTLDYYITQAKSGDEQAFTILVQKLSTTVSSIALAITKDIHHSNDVSQLVFITMWQKISKLKNNDSFLPWIRQITRYTAINFIRNNKTNREQTVDALSIDQLLEHVCDGKHQEDSQLIKQQQSELITHLLEQLPNESREIILLYYREDNDSQTVAHLLGLSASTVRKRLQRVRDLLKTEVLSKYGKVIFASAPVGLTTAMAVNALATSPAIAATLTSGLVKSQSHWLLKVIASFGGAMIGGFIAVFVNNFIAKKIIKNLDNEQDIQHLIKHKNRANTWMIFSSVLMTISYIYTDGWLLPVGCYVLFVLGLKIFIDNINQINFVNLSNKAKTDPIIARKLNRDKWGCRLGWFFGIIGGTSGLVIGLYNSGRFAQLF